MKLKHSKSELKRKEQEMQKTAAQYAKDKSLMDRIEQEVNNLKVSTLHLLYTCKYCTSNQKILPSNYSTVYTWINAVYICVSTKMSCYP